ncbi:hypothetical protein [Kocuria sp. UCD-OTCP]|uniref:hypothetical protein n=1 Tax=Kocuria sp. UCD-OTCP TaxID=1292021 RepID=UPI00035E6254|nr:hypothetical protein [Kocuria sp. UCD-OTCP]EYT53290.1 hypothetical protein H488_0107340 [Kocuria sp. UCD-OTCP]
MTDQIETDDNNTWWKAPRFLISAVLVAMLIVLGIVLWLWPDGEEPTQAAPAPATTAEPVSDGESVCGLDATGGTTLTKAPEDVEWTALGAIYAPSSEEHGPGTVDESTGVRSCYSHTPEGALLAATNMLTASGDPELLLETTRLLGMEGPGKDVAIGQIQQRIAGGDNTSVPVQVAGFRLLSYTGDTATVEVVLAGDDGSEKVYNTTGGNLVWHEGDWRFAFDDDGSGGPVSGRVSDLSGYIAWGPGNG